MTAVRTAPHNCPVCGSRLALTRLSCDECDTELSGHFPVCDYCDLNDEDRETLRVFLVSRGNMKEVERHLAVSYPTARARFDSILRKLGFEAENTERVRERPAMDVLEALSKGEIDVNDALERLGRT